MASGKPGVDLATGDTVTAMSGDPSAAASPPPTVDAHRHRDATRPSDRATSQVEVTLPVVAGSGGDDLTKLPIVSRNFYSIGGELARGGMGRILYARDRRVGRPVAIKELRAHHPVAVARFLREATLTARLQHPGIVPIYEAGRWEDGAPFFAMKMVEGHSLDRVIASAETPRDRLALLPNVIAVADAMAYAHSRGVIHRDLKPANILVGKYGETVVIDWGLGKNLGDTAAADLALSVDAEADAILTMAGAAMGTPSYMAPEQAMGGAVDERSDVYALGALLYQVLAGKAPYVGSAVKNADQALDLVRSGPPRPLAELAPETPVELVDVVDRAMARAPTDRYPSAEALAADLERYQTGQLVAAHAYSLWELLTRWVAKHRAPVAIAAAAALTLAVLSGIGIQRIRSERTRAEEQRSVAIAQRAQAEASRAEVEDLLDFMLVELRAKLEPIGRLDVLALVARKAADYYAESPLEREPPQHTARRARSLAQLAEVLREQGDRAGAMKNHRTALALRRGLVDQNRAEGKWRYELSLSLCQLGDLWLGQGEAEPALTAYQECDQLRRRLVEEHPRGVKYRGAWAASQERIGNALLHQGDVPTTLAQFGLAQQNLELLVAENPQLPGPREGLAAIHDQIGLLAATRGDATEALARYRAAVEITTRLRDEEPDAPARHRSLAVVQTNIGDLLLASGESQAAVESYRAALAAFERVTAIDPSNATWQRELAATQTKVAAGLHQQGDLAGALALHRRALAVRERSFQGDPDDRSRQSDLANSYVLVASAIASGHPTPESRALGRRAAELYATSATSAQDFYNAACGYSLADDRDQAFAMLGRAVDLGFVEVSALDQDPDLATLRTDPRWAALRSRIDERP